MQRFLLFLVGFAGAVAASCVPADGAISLGSASFTIKATPMTEQGFSTVDTNRRGKLDPWQVSIDRVLLSFKTMTIGKVGEEDRCSYRGRGATNDIVFDPRFGIVQTFNGVEQSECPDVGVVFGPPEAGTDIGPGATVKDALDLRAGFAAHALVEATGRRAGKTLRIVLRFDTARTAAKFGGCQAGSSRGITVIAGARDEATVSFAAEMLFREGVSTTLGTRLEPFEVADADEDGVVTMAEIDAITLLEAAGQTGSEFYQLPDGSRSGTFGDYVRQLFRFAVYYRGNGGCVGNEPGTE